MDETPVSFDLPTNYTVDNKGTKTVFIKTSGHEKCRFTVVLGCMVDGTRLPPTVIFKSKALPKGAKISKWSFGTCPRERVDGREWHLGMVRKSME